jgi:hypothetical protein
MYAPARQGVAPHKETVPVKAWHMKHKFSLCNFLALRPHIVVSAHGGCVACGHHNSSIRHDKGRVQFQITPSINHRIPPHNQCNLSTTRGGTPSLSSHCCHPTPPFSLTSLTTTGFMTGCSPSSWDSR